jgi:hypothetical protein
LVEEEQPDPFNKLKIMSEVVLLLSNTDPFNKLKIMSEVVLLLPNNLQLIEGVSIW